MKPGPAAKKNVLFIAYEFPPRGESGVQRSAKFVKYLPDFGYKPFVLTKTVEEISTTVDDTLMRDVKDTTIIRCRGNERWLVRIPHKIEFLRRLIKFCLRPDQYILAWVPEARRMALQITREHPIDVIYTTVFPYSTGVLGRRLKEILGIPWVVDFRDPWIDDSLRFWPSKFHYWFEARQERRIVEAADAVIVVTPTMKKLMIARYPKCADKIHVITNGFDSADFPARRNSGPPGSKLHIGYAGRLIEHDRWTVRGSRGPFTRFWMSHIAFRHSVADLSTHSPYHLLRAVRALLDERPEWKDKITLSFAGIFGEKNLELVRDLKLENVVSVKGYLPHAESIQSLLESDVLFLPMKRSTDGKRSYIYTGKLFEYLATRRPILAAIPEGDARDLIREARAGWCVDPHDVGAIKSLLEDLVERKMAGVLNTNLDEKVVSRFQRRELTRQLAALFDSLTSERKLSGQPWHQEDVF